MSVHARDSRRRTSKKQTHRYLTDSQREHILHYLPVWLIGAVIAAIIFPRLLDAAVELTLNTIGAVPRVIVGAAEGVYGLGEAIVIEIGDAVSDTPTAPQGDIAPLFTAEIDHWGADIDRWAVEYDLDPNLLATVMQIESCGHPTVSSPAGAQGLFQVMPFHFASTENQLDPDTNAMRGAGVLNECLRLAEGDTGLAMACYNGGPSVIWADYETWLAEPQRYYTWGTGIYADAQQNSSTSPTLDRWLNAGGATLCDMAAAEQSRAS